MQYYELPAELLEDTEELRSWVEKAVAVARSAKRKKTRRNH
jgi:TfoX/Sxy family transcriptional regulator of competence genes